MTHITVSPADHAPAAVPANKAITLHFPDNALLSLLLGESADALAALNKTRQLTSQIETLSALLPLCAWCKRVRTDTGEEVIAPAADTPTGARQATTDSGSASAAPSQPSRPNAAGRPGRAGRLSGASLVTCGLPA